MKFVKFLALFVLLAVSAFAAGAQDKNTGTIKGKVRVERGSAAGVAVILRQNDQEVRRVATDRKGEFTMTRVPAGTYGLTFRKAGLAVGSMENVEVKAGKTRSLSDHLFLAVDEGAIAFIRGSVFSEAGRSVAGVRIELSRVVSDTAVDKLDSRITGETGEFVFRVPPEAAKYRVTLKADKAESVSKDVEVDSALVYRVSLMYKPKP
jgi:carboxypeptidase family protein